LPESRLGGGGARCYLYFIVPHRLPYACDDRYGSNASVELSWHVGFTPDFGRMVATQELTLRAKNRTDLSPAVYFPDLASTL
jgi:hypothetical protein